MIEALAASFLTAGLVLGGRPILRAVRARWRRLRGRAHVARAALPPGQGAARRAPRDHAAPPSPPVIGARKDPGDAIGAATAFLKACIRTGAYGTACFDQHGMPQFSHNRGHVYTAPFLVEALGPELDEIERALILTRLLSEEQGGLWGYSLPGKRHVEHSNDFHVDADDTAFALRTLQLLDLNRPVDCLLRFYREESGLFATFDSLPSVELALEHSDRNNRMAHSEVNLNIFRVLKDTHLDHLIRPELLAEAQDPAGFWRSYHYPSPLYATELAVDVLEGKPNFAGALSRSIGFVADTQNADGSWGLASDPCETAMAIRILAGRVPDNEPARRGADYLRRSIRHDGSWSSDAALWCQTPWGDQVWSGYDDQRSHVTARCLIALKAVEALGPA